MQPSQLIHGLDARLPGSLLVVILLSLVGLVGLAGCGSTGEPERKVTGEESTSDTARPSLGEATALEGAWSTDATTVEDMVETLRAAGLGKSVRGFRQNAPISGAPTVLTLEIGDEWNLTGKPQGGQPAEIDYDAGYSVSGDEVVVIHSEGSNTFRWSVSGDVLQLTWLETTFEGGYAGVPEEAYQRALYMTADFRRKS